MKFWQVLAVLLVVSCPYAFGQDTIKLLRPVWQSLGGAERASIQQRYVVDVRDPAAYGLVMDNQGVDISTAGTTGGAALGGALANAAYIDRALSPSNIYSAKTQLAAGILGAIIGSSLDKPAIQQYHFRYALKLQGGEITYRESVQGDPFRHPMGMCLELATLSPAPQTLCTQTTADVRKAYLVLPSTEAIPGTQQDTVPNSQEVTVAPAVSGRVDCKLGNLAPVSTTLEKCNSIGGKPL